MCLTRLWVMDEAQLDLVGGQTMWIPSNFPFFLSTDCLWFLPFVIFGIMEFLCREGTFRFLYSRTEI
ncbi:uncharacterized protein EURHEDRAFT_407949 [Aspergillus ruber CBS 135680]|uniref:Uncharacterized protein n=1 Tax=Aspergillus ruber (strain CBS 135680) TaxID=1388766 RepID=A0A017STK4_ASPRC|nr:uncharacterized protein EURHEDRAFT_407949 [Aspergillus ruber CBS 135680]EYE99939.1 hypothetical protein EURHEDRAFT_407949 [Aspergillus ruber CBS 135680]